MLENINDYLSFIVMALFVFMSLYSLFAVTDSHHDRIMKDRQERYYSYYENTDDTFDDENRNDPYFE